MITPNMLYIILPHHPLKCLSSWDQQLYLHCFNQLFLFHLTLSALKPDYAPPATVVNHEILHSSSKPSVPKILIRKTQSIGLAHLRQYWKSMLQL